MPPSIPFDTEVSGRTPTSCARRSRPWPRGGRLLSVASAGDNALALLTLDPAEVVAVDLSLAQLACLELRVAAFRELDDAELLGFLGVTEASDRLSRYRSLRDNLPDFARTFWDHRPELVESGVVHAGKFEAYFHTFRRSVLPWIHPRQRVEALLSARSGEERETFYRGEWDSWRWRLMFRVFFSRAVMGRLGRDPAFFHHVDGPVASRVRDRSRRGFTTLPTHTNPYLTCILTGRYRAEALPPVPPAGAPPEDSRAAEPPSDTSRACRGRGRTLRRF